MTGYSLSYILDSLSLDQLMMLYSHGLEFEETKSIILVNKIAECFFGAKGKKSKDISDKPDLKKLNILFGDRIKTPDKKE